LSKLEERYTKLLKEVEEVNRNKLMLEGRKKAYLEELQQLGYDSVEDAIEKIDSLKSELEKLHNKISDELTIYETEMEKIKNV
jgi:F0F1-type ATP synthase membrane subunit b/b'